MALTGRFNLRKSFSGRIILQVEEELESKWGLFSQKPKFRRRWRDAKPMDLPATELRSLMDLRNRPHSFMQAFEPTLVARPLAHKTDPVQSTVASSALPGEENAATAH
ncbi:hypothetical protein VB618_11025 [Microvirga sp. CF3062]|uniref:hypothetical protein n=1 Tax=Microvirga sp. CF3062 TaxID=3110182 RepID=UPI002E7939B3|nr:hypothetical protein [Microvirga sp. CF3062]MEE1656731.1 hypothetical protein [Microvirga sp. CF3062]